MVDIPALSVFETINIDIKFILDQTELLRLHVPLRIGLVPLALKGHLKSRLQRLYFFIY